MSSSSSVEVTLTRMAFGGEAIGQLPDGRAIFVPFGIPGEKVRLKITQEKSRHARGEIVEIVEASPQRIPARCCHFQTCGGCAYQHLAYPDQLRIKNDILVDQLQRIGGLKDIPILPAVPSPQAWFYRNQVQFHLDPGGRLGYKKHLSDQVVPITECFLPEPGLNDLWPQLEFDAGMSIKRVGLRSGSGEDCLLVLESEPGLTPEVCVEGLPVSVVSLTPAGSQVLAGSDHLEIEIKGRQLVVSAGSFFQVNHSLAELMLDSMLTHLPLSSKTRLLDVYCGVGFFSVFLATQVERLVGIEISPQACHDFEINLDEFDNVALYEAPAEAVLPYLETNFDVILVDPPRAGLAAKALEGILKIAPLTLAYVSCDPSSLARDAKSLVAAGYKLKETTLFDMFPQTAHIESLSFWEKV